MTRLCKDMTHVIIAAWAIKDSDQSQVTSDFRNGRKRSQQSVKLSPSELRAAEIFLARIGPLISANSIPSGTTNPF